jgi:fructose-specific phosphotransferase system IIB component
MKIVALTACAGGIAHTYMAAEAFIKSAKAAGDEARAEIQGSMGIENRLTTREIEEADLVIYIANIAVRGKDRFEGKLVIEADPGPFVADGEKALREVKERAGLV